MSRKATVDYDAFSIKQQAKCNVAQNLLCKMNRSIEHIQATASKLRTEKIKEIEEYLLNEKNKITSQINVISQKLELYKNKGTEIIDDESVEYVTLNSIDKETQKLIDITQSLTA